MKIPHLERMKNSVKTKKEREMPIKAFLRKVEEYHVNNNETLFQII